MKEKKAHPTLLIVGTLFVVIAFILLPHGLRRRSQGGRFGFLLPAPTEAEAAEVSSWAQSVRRVKENRGEPVGNQAQVDTPPELRHYSDKRRFLAVQVAELREHKIATLRDFIDLSSMLTSGEMVELQPVTHDYILFGVGGSADTGPFMRYENGEKIPIFNETGLEQEYARLAESRTALETETAGLQQELKSLNKHDRAGRTKVQNQISEKEKALKAISESKEMLDRHYDDAEGRQQLFRDYESLEKTAKSFPDQTYNIEDSRSRQALKVRMLSSLRPEAVKILEEVSSAYHQKFDRPLPVSSLVRPDEYQQALSKVNPNATRIQMPPHATGLAFDINYHYMSAEEQSFVMNALASLKDEGRIEVLRENRDNYHVFAFIDGVVPSETFIRASLNEVSTHEDTKEPQTNE
jgi:hypothetical protein